MKKQNIKNGNYILIKNRRILTRTEQSNQKIKLHLNYNHFLNQTRQPQQNLSYKNINPHPSGDQDTKISRDEGPFWKTPQRRKFKSQIEQNTTAFETGQSNLQRVYAQSIFQKVRHKKSHSRMFDMYKHRIFSHKNLHQEPYQSKNKSDKKLVKFTSTHQLQRQSGQGLYRNNFTEQDQKIENINDSLENTLKNQQITEAYSNEQSLNRLLQNLFTKKRRKLRIIPQEYSLFLRLNQNQSKLSDMGQIQSNSQTIKVIDAIQTQQTDNLAKIQTKKLKTPHQILNRIHERSQLKLSNKLNKGQQQNSGNKQNTREKAKFIQNIDIKDQIEVNLVQKDSKKQERKARKIKQTSHKTIQDQNLSIRNKQSNKMPKNTRSNIKKKQAYLEKIEQSSQLNFIETPNAISIQDINITHQSVVSSARKKQNGEQHEKTHVEQKCQERKKRQFFTKKSDLYPVNPKLQLKNNISNNSELRQPQKKNNQKAEKNQKTKLNSFYQDFTQISFVQEIFCLQVDKNNVESENKTNASKKNKKVNLQLEKTKKEPQNLEQSTFKISSPQRQTRERAEKMSQGQSKRSEIQDVKDLQRKIAKVKQNIEYVTCTGQVASYCSQLLGRKNTQWLVPSLLLYKYCEKVNQDSIAVYEEACKKQLCSQTQYSTFIQEGQMLKQNRLKIYRKCEKKGLVTQYIQTLMASQGKSIRRNRKFYKALLDQISNFVKPLINKKESRQSQDHLNQITCGIRMVVAFLKAVKMQFVILRTQQQNGKNENQILADKIIIPQIDLNNLSLAQGEAFLPSIYADMIQYIGILRKQLSI